MLVPHGYFYTTHGLTKHDAPPTFFFQMPYWPLTHRLSEQIAHIQESFKDTSIKADVFVYEPSGSLPTPEEGELYKAVLYHLAGKQLDFLMAEPEIIDGMDRDLAGKTLVVIKTASEEPEKAEALELFKSRGGQVITVGKPEDLDYLGLRPLLDFSLTGHRPDRLWMVTRESDEGDRIFYFLNTSDLPLEIRFPAPRHLTEFAGGAPVEYRGERKNHRPL